MSPGTKMTACFQAQFLQMLPQIRRVGSYAYRHLSFANHEELVAEVVANAYAAFVRLVELGRAEVAHPTVLALFAVKQINCGRRVGNRRNANDVMCPLAQRTKGFKVARLQVRDRDGGWKEMVVQDKRSTPADVAICRLDFESWLDGLDERKRAVALRLAQGDCTSDAATNCRLTAGRISQIRGELEQSWNVFQGETPELAAA